MNTALITLDCENSCDIKGNTERPAHPSIYLSVYPSIFCNAYPTQDHGEPEIYRGPIVGIFTHTHPHMNMLL